MGGPRRRTTTSTRRAPWCVTRSSLWARRCSRTCTRRTRGEVTICDRTTVGKRPLSALRETPEFWRAAPNDAAVQWGGAPPAVQRSFEDHQRLDREEEFGLPPEPAEQQPRGTGNFGRSHHLRSEMAL